MFNIHTKKIQFGDKILELETGKIARQASGSVVAKMGNTVVLCTVVGAKKPKEDIDFFPLSVHYIEKFYAAGKFPGGYFKRENRPSEREVLISRLIDRPIRPLFPDNFHNEVQVICTTVSYDPAYQPDIIAMAGVSAALAISGIPFEQPIAGARVGYKNGEYTLNSSAAELADGSQLDLVVAGTKDAVLMVESQASELSEEVMLGAVMFGHKAFQAVIKGITEFAEEAGKERWNLELKDSSAVAKQVSTLAKNKIVAAYKEVDKKSRRELLDAAKEEVKKALVEGKELSEVEVTSCFKNLEKDIVRSNILASKKGRIDGRSYEDVRNIVCEVDLLPQTHGSALFTRGETQVLAVTTLGTGDDEQMIDTIEGAGTEKFMLHYNFPPYSVGEVGRLGAPGRREVGHGKLAFRAISGLIPAKEQFPYTIRVVSEVTESNGSSSMATVCGTSMSLMAAGVPLPSPVAGIAMGLILEGSKYAVLSDIMGDEDHLGDMDFKVAGTDKGITALQMDIKISGITEEIMEKALKQAKDGRLHILGKMADAITEARSAIASTAPQIQSFTVPKEKIGEIIGPGGKVIKNIIEVTKVKIDINDEGVVNIASTSSEAMQEALQMVKDIIAVPEIGKVYHGKVVKLVDFGAFVSIMKNSEGLVHVSEMADKRVNNPKDILSEGQMVDVKVIGIERGKVKLTMKGLNNPTSEAQGGGSTQEGGEDAQPNFEGSDQPREPREHREKRPFGKKRFKKSGGGNRSNDRSDDNRGGERGGDHGNQSQSQGKKRRFF